MGHESAGGQEKFPEGKGVRGKEFSVDSQSQQCQSRKKKKLKNGTKARKGEERRKDQAHRKKDHQTNFQEGSAGLLIGIGEKAGGEKKKRKDRRQL